MQRLQKVPTQSSKSPPGTDDSNSPCLKSGTRSQSRVLQSKTSGLKIFKGIGCHLGEGRQQEWAL